MRRLVLGLLAVGLLLETTTVWAATSLSEVTPQNIQKGTFRLTYKAAPNNTVEFVIRRDVRNISLPDRPGYVSNPKVDEPSLGRQVKREQHGSVQTFRFSVPSEQVPSSVFTLWGGGAAAGEAGVTYQFRLGEFWKARKG